MKIRSLFIILIVAVISVPLIMAQATAQERRVVSDRSQTREMNPDRIEDWRNKTLMGIWAHPDDELSASGTMAKLVKNGNTVILVFLTSGNKGSRDLTMTSERLAKIRRQEDIEANKVLGIPEENILFLGYDDGMLEYVPEMELVERVCRLIRKYRPDAVMCFDSGDKYVTWHKTDHRMAAKVALDGARAAAYHLYFPHHLIYENLQPWTVVDFFFRGGAEEPNFRVDVTDVAELRAEAFTKHTSQHGKGNAKYVGPIMDPEDAQRRRERALRKDADGKIWESFRRVRRSLSF
jgi:LmbE family N-acetylglucosaminyl deacetylase